MKVLLDTQVWLWMLDGAGRLSAGSRALVENPETGLLLSTASAWEIAIKHASGKLRLPADPEAIVPGLLLSGHVEALPMLLEHALHAGSLPPHHRDPFDRMLIAQAQLERLAIVTADPAFDAYDVEVIAA